MDTVAKFLVAIVIALQGCFLVFEMFFWASKRATGVHGLTQPCSGKSVPVGRNMGLYNGFLGAGLVWGLCWSRPDVTIFFLACVLVAGVFGAITLRKLSVLLAQAAPALAALAAVLLAGKAIG